MPAKKRLIELEQEWREEYKAEFGHFPTEAEVNIAVYGERMPTFNRTMTERAVLTLRGNMARLKTPTRFALEIAKYAIAFAVGSFLYESIRTLF